METLNENIFIWQRTDKKMKKNPCIVKMEVHGFELHFVHNQKKISVRLYPIQVETLNENILFQRRIKWTEKRAFNGRKNFFHFRIAGNKLSLLTLSVD